MAEFPLYATGLVMALFLVAIVAAVLRMRKWKDDPTPPRRGAVARTASSLAHSLDAWMVGFLVVTLALGFGAVLLAGGEFVAVDPGLLRSAVLGILGGLLVLFVFLGTYFSVRERGGASARGVALGLLLLGLLVLAVISGQLMGWI
ncbi:hypothetical protein BRD00_15145 [Halobacteriales archaeon QS_8_69_26]|nr:MAG: hypothetical protein BRD00_15145 [Halobacteriales archaeon QS_8_69_26]